VPAQKSSQQSRNAKKRKQGNSKGKRRAVRQIDKDAEQLRVDASLPPPDGGGLMSPSAGRRVRARHSGEATPNTPTTPHPPSPASPHPPRTPRVPRKNGRKRSRASASSPASTPAPTTPNTRARACSQPPPVKRKRRLSHKQRLQQSVAHARAVKAGTAAAAQARDVDADELWVAGDVDDDDADDTVAVEGVPIRLPGPGVRLTQEMANQICVMRFHARQQLMDTIEDSSKKWHAEQPTYEQIASLLGVSAKTVSSVCKFYEQHHVVPTPSPPQRGRRRKRATCIDSDLYGGVVKLFLSARSSVCACPTDLGVRPAHAAFERACSRPRRPACPGPVPSRRLATDSPR
jgi:hypothetical protein